MHSTHTNTYTQCPPRHVAACICSVNDISSVLVSSLSHSLSISLLCILLVPDQNNVHLIQIHSMRRRSANSLKTCFSCSRIVDLSLCELLEWKLTARLSPLVPVTQFMLFVYIPTFMREVVSHLSLSLSRSPTDSLHEKLIQLSFHS